ncbi:MAG: extracellular solute-binding protein, partial [Thermoproteota archaeon]|nr:extracellular solute-binding protein [Thermoproteota archaeon]
MTGGWRPDEINKYCVAKIGPTAIAFLAIIITPPILQPALATATNLPPTNTTMYADNNDEYNNSVTVLLSNQSDTLRDKTNVTLRGLFTDLANPGRWNQLLQPALDELNRRHPDMNIQIQYTDFPYNVTRDRILDRLSSGDAVDIVSVDQIWLGEFAERGTLRNLTSDFEQWGRIDDLYESNLDGCVYNNTIYGLWLWTDIRGM